MKLIDGIDATYFTRLYDNWLYSNNPWRYSGFRAAILPKVGFTNSNYFSKTKDIDYTVPLNSENTSYTNNNQTNIGARIYYEYDKPINLNWQRSAIFIVRYDYANAKRTNPEPEDQWNQKGFNVYGSYGFGYYPNTRTRIDFSVNSEYRSIKGNVAHRSNDVVLKSLSIYPYINVYYYFSPRLSLQLYGNISFNLYNNTTNLSYVPLPWTPGFNFTEVDGNNIRFNMWAQFTYSIF